jgi:hypothetical protein
MAVPVENPHEHCDQCVSASAESRRERQRDAQRRFLASLPEEVRKAGQNARKGLERAALNRRQLLTRAAAGLSSLILRHIIDAKPLPRTGLHEGLSKHLRKIERELALGNEPRARSEAFFFPVSLLIGDVGTTAAHLRLRRAAILRDAGGPAAFQYAREVEEGYALLKGEEARENLARALIGHASMDRTHKNYREAMPRYRLSESLLRELDWRKERKSTQALLFFSALWQHRLIMAYGDGPEAKEAKEKRSLTLTLAKQVNTPYTWVEVLREESRRCLLLKDFEGAREYLAAAKDQFSALPVKSDNTRMSLARLGVELSSAAGWEEEAEEFATELLDLLRIHPYGYFLQHLQNLKTLKTSQSVKMTAFDAYTLPYLYLEDAFEEVLRPA